MRDTLKTGMSRTVAQSVAVFAVVFGLLNAQCFAACTAISCAPAPKRVAPVERASSHCHREPADKTPTAPVENKQCAHETLELRSWQEVKPVTLSYAPAVELHNIPEQTLFILSAPREISPDAVSPPLAGIVRSTVLRI